MLELLTDFGLLSLFLLSFCAATLIPLGSEWLLISLLLNGTDPFLSVATASLGNSLGAISSYLIGLGGSSWLIDKLLRIDQQQRLRAQNIFARYGCWALLFSWLPIIGDPLCLMAGVLNHNFYRFILLVAIGKTARYCAVAVLTLTSSNLL